MTMSITSLTHHAETAGDMVSRLRNAGILERRISVELPASPASGSTMNALVNHAAATQVRWEWLAFLALGVAVALFHVVHSPWTGPAVVGLTAAMLSCVAWAGLEQAAGEWRRQRYAEMVQENGVLITVHDVDGAESECIDQLLHDSGSEAISHSVEPK